jgi:hypothetical protein
MIPAQLPPWIPKEDSQALLDIYRRQLCEELFILQDKSLRPSNSTQVMGNIPSEPSSSSNTAGEAKDGRRWGFFGVLNFKFNFKRLLKAVSFNLVWKN